MSLQPCEPPAVSGTPHKATKQKSVSWGWGSPPSPGPVAQSTGGDRRGRGGPPWEATRLLAPAYHRKGKVKSKTASRQEQSKARLSSLGKAKLMRRQRCTTPPQWQGWAWEKGALHRMFESESLPTT